ncbi:DUF2568 domain-containing protein [Streptococcus dentiloxodontae]
MSALVMSVRFLLEIVTVSGLVGGIFTRRSWLIKIIFALLGFAIALVWSRYGAPKSPQVLTGTAKLLLEIAAFGLGAIGAFVLYGKNVGWIYSSIALLDLIGVYALGLNV